jgi:hypothetical protein
MVLSQPQVERAFRVLRSLELEIRRFTIGSPAGCEPTCSLVYRPIMRNGSYAVC